MWGYNTPTERRKRTEERRGLTMFYKKNSKNASKHTLNARFGFYDGGKGRKSGVSGPLEKGRKALWQLVPNATANFFRWATANGSADCTGLTSVTFEHTTGWYLVSNGAATGGSYLSVLSNRVTAAMWLSSTFCDYYWKRNA